MKNLSRLYHLVLAVMLVLLVPAASRAQLVFTAENVTTYPGQTGSFDLNLTNTGPDLDLRGWTAALTLTNNPNFDVKLDQFVPGSNGQFFDYLVHVPTKRGLELPVSA